jgi:citrate lyase subunit beta/citryl-CoA lyase
MNHCRSWLFVPGDSEKKIEKALVCSADALVFDLEDSVTAERRGTARDLVAQALQERRARGRRWVRINPLSSAEAMADLSAIVGSSPPDGVVLPKADGIRDVERLSYYLDALEAHAGVSLGGIRILVVATETPAASFSLGEYAGCSLPRLAGLTWGAEDLSSAIGASTNKAADGSWAFTYQLMRSTTLLAAKAAQVDAIDTLHADYRDLDGLRASCNCARADGFDGKIAIHPAQVDVINECFTPTPAELDFARKVVAAFAANPSTATVGIEGRMYDLPHLKLAHRILEREQGRSSGG